MLAFCGWLLAHLLSHVNFEGKLTARVPFSRELHHTINEIWLNLYPEPITLVFWWDPGLILWSALRKAWWQDQTWEMSWSTRKAKCLSEITNGSYSSLWSSCPVISAKLLETKQSTCHWFYLCSKLHAKSAPPVLVPETDALTAGAELWWGWTAPLLALRMQ